MEKFLTGFTWRYNRVCEPVTVEQESYYLQSPEAWMRLLCDGKIFIESPLRATDSMYPQFGEILFKLPLNKVRIDLPIWAEPVLRVVDGS